VSKVWRGTCLKLQKEDVLPRLPAGRQLLWIVPTEGVPPDNTALIG
jgi:hypothetical protein